MLTVSNNVTDTSFTTKDETFFDNGISDAEWLNGQLSQQLVLKNVVHEILQ